MLLKTLLVFIVFSKDSLSLAQSKSVADQNSCAVQLRTISADGALKAYKVSSFLRHDGVNFAQKFDGLKGRVPCDGLHRYRYLLSPTGPRRASDPVGDVEGEIDVANAEVWKTVTVAPFGGVHGAIVGKYVLRGRLIGQKVAGLWVGFKRLAYVGEYDEASTVEAEVQSDGSFRIYTVMPRGAYLLYVTDERQRVLHVQSAWCDEFPPRQPLEIVLPQSPPLPLMLH